MDSFEVNKIIGAVLGTVFVVFSLNLISDTLFAAHSPEKPGYIIESAEPGAAGPAEGGVAAAPEPVGPLLASADVAAGESLFKRCAACHTPDNGGANKIGPNLWHIVDRPVASHEGYAYSAAMKEHANARPTWDYEHLSDFLTSPKAVVKGTAMNFPGIKAVGDRANIIAYLRTLSDSPAPLPEATPAPAAAAPAEAPAAAPAAPATEGATPPATPAPAQ
jgi:cytochrome c